ncbi:hypothetical protein [Nocardia sp. NPDC060259]|uniref:hypothetical protein n=1 Tax=Nocardia sp. NPDC060259 TaxID=3347088 RepID=UPI0036568065
MLSSLGDAPDTHRHLGPAGSVGPGSGPRAQTGQQLRDVARGLIRPHVELLVRGLGARAVVLPRGGHLGAYADDHIDLPEAVTLVEEVLAHRG